MKRFFIMGTDTNCGKTYATCQLLTYFKGKGKTALGIKPMASGCIEAQGELINEDVQQLQFYNASLVHKICKWRFKEPISPHLAASREGLTITSRAIRQFCDKKEFSSFDYLLIEGAGGLMAPINDRETWLDCLSGENISVILVVGMRLGCLNHALLTELALTTRQIPIIGWVANCLDKNMLALQENIATLENKLNSPLLAIIPHGGGVVNLSEDFS